MQWEVDEIASWWDGKFMKQQFDILANWEKSHCWYVILMKMQVDEMESWKTATWWNDRLATQHVNDESSLGVKLRKYH